MKRIYYVFVTIVFLFIALNVNISKADTFSDSDAVETRYSSDGYRYERQNCGSYILVTVYDSNDRIVKTYMENLD